MNLTDDRENEPCGYCGKPVHLLHDPPCRHGAVYCDYHTCPTCHHNEVPC